MLLFQLVTLTVSLHIVKIVDAAFTSLRETRWWEMVLKEPSIFLLQSPYPNELKPIVFLRTTGIHAVAR